MATALIHLDAKQKKRLQRRAKLRGKSFSLEVRDAVDLYLDLPVNDEELKLWRGPQISPLAEPSKSWTRRSLTLTGY
jgi:hypothetical protein